MFSAAFLMFRVGPVDLTTPTLLVGVKVSVIKSAAKVVLPKHYSEDLHPETWRVFSSCGRK
ncbi:hypothetical protein ACS0TY_023344 [Phlomoides rotata]